MSKKIDALHPLDNQQLEKAILCRAGPMVGWWPGVVFSYPAGESIPGIGVVEGTLALVSKTPKCLPLTL